MIVGHERQLGWLGRELPPVTLLYGPVSVGKRTLAEHLLAFRGGVAVEVLNLTAEGAREVADEAVIAPAGSRKNIIVRLDGASERAQNILLKTLEEPALTTGFVLLSSGGLLPTIRSRCARVPFGLLTESQVCQVLVSLGAPEADARAAAPLGDGQVKPAQAALADLEAARKERGVVATALKAALSGEPGLLLAAMRSWEPAHTRLLTRWAVEKTTGRWSRFDESVAPGATAEQARRLLATLSLYSGARMAAAVSLAEVFEPAA